jgi:hypothetical protein
MSQPLMSTPEAEARRLVLGAAVGFDIARVRVFVESLRGVGYRDDILIMTGPLQWRLNRYLARHGVETRSVLSTRKLNGPIHAYRFDKFARFVAQLRSHYARVLISDVRDVVFQRDPFAGVVSTTCQFYLEGASKTIGEEPTNLRWAKLFLPPNEVAAISACRVSCCGVVQGGSSQMADYLDRMAAYLHRLPLRLRREGGADTVFHNRIAHLTHEVPADIIENNIHVATMGLEPPLPPLARCGVHLRPNGQAGLDGIGAAPDNIAGQKEHATFRALNYESAVRRRGLSLDVGDGQR